MRMNVVIFPISVHGFVVESGIAAHSVIHLCFVGSGGVLAGKWASVQI